MNFFSGSLDGRYVCANALSASIFTALGDAFSIRAATGKHSSLAHSTTCCFICRLSSIRSGLATELCSSSGLSSRSFLLLSAAADLATTGPRRTTALPAARPTTRAGTRSTTAGEATAGVSFVGAGHDRCNGKLAEVSCHRKPATYGSHAIAMPAAIPTLNALWRPNTASTRDDRELIRSYANWPVSNYNLTQLTVALNRVADTSTATVTQVQAWIDEVEDLEQSWADQVADGTAHLGNVSSYEGPAPGTTLSRDDLKKRADVLEWDTSLLRVKYESGGRADATAGATIATRIAQLKRRVFQAIGIQPGDATAGQAQLLRS